MESASPDSSPTNSPAKESISFKSLVPLSKLITQKITFGCPILDRHLGGGIPTSMVTEVVGESGSGKTQLMLQLACNTQLPEVLGGLCGHTLFLNSEQPFPIKRLHQIACLNPFLEDNPLDKVFVQSIQTLDELQKILACLDSYLEKSNIKLIIIDSITTLFRGEFANTGADMKARQNLFFKIGSKFKLYAAKYNLAVVVTNHVVDMLPQYNNVRIGNDAFITTSGRAVIPALGLSWANCVNIRFQIALATVQEKGSSSHKQSTGGSKVVQDTRRELKVSFAPHVGIAAAEFVICDEGIFGRND